jgi:TRAP-type mannitol/chloroaromatic compound transport system permease large subunit
MPTSRQERLLLGILVMLFGILITLVGGFPIGFVLALIALLIGVSVPGSPRNP